MNIDAFKEFIRIERPKKMLSPFELSYQSFNDLGFTKKDKEFFLENESLIVEQLREKNWEKFLELEREFTGFVFEKLIDKNKVEESKAIDIIKWFVTEYSDHIYALSLSNTQSRRSRAGNEFEAIIELILMGAKIPFDTQGSIGTGVFESSNLAKLVDCVSPGASEYKINKRNTSLISAKTTLRERWQEVGDEMDRTKAREMYLATLDDSLSKNVIQLIGENNIIIVTTKSNKDSLYSDSQNVISFEYMVEELSTKALAWDNYSYSHDIIKEKTERYSIQLDKFKDNSF